MIVITNFSPTLLQFRYDASETFLNFFLLNSFILDLFGTFLGNSYKQRTQDMKAVTNTQSIWSYIFEYKNRFSNSNFLSYDSPIWPSCSMAKMVILFYWNHNHFFFTFLFYFLLFSYFFSTFFLYLIFEGDMGQILQSMEFWGSPIRSTRKCTGRSRRRERERMAWWLVCYIYVFILLLNVAEKNFLGYW